MDLLSPSFFLVGNRPRPAADGEARQRCAAAGGGLDRYHGGLAHGSAIGTWATRQAEAARRKLDWIRNRCPLFGKPRKSVA